MHASDDCLPRALAAMLRSNSTVTSLVIDDVSIPAKVSAVIVFRIVAAFASGGAGGEQKQRAALAGAAAHSTLLRVSRFNAPCFACAAKALASALLAEPERFGTLLRYAARESSIELARGTGYRVQHTGSRRIQRTEQLASRLQSVG